MASSFIDHPTLQAWATCIGLPIPPEAEAGVLANLDRLQALAIPLLEFSLSDHDEPLPIALYDVLPQSSTLKQMSASRLSETH